MSGALELTRSRKEKIAIQTSDGLITIYWTTYRCLPKEIRFHIEAPPGVKIARLELLLRDGSFA